MEKSFAGQEAVHFLLYLVLTHTCILGHGPSPRRRERPAGEEGLGQSFCSLSKEGYWGPYLFKKVLNEKAPLFICLSSPSSFSPSPCPLLGDVSLIEAVQLCLAGSPGKT